jgi:hypothetical protein
MQCWGPTRAMPHPTLIVSRYPSRLRRLAVLPVFVTASLVGAASARAATVAPSSGSVVTHTLPNGNGYTRDPSLNPSGINYEDCEEDVSFNFSITVTDATPGADQLFVYAGTNCGDATQRTGAAGSTCWQVLDGAQEYTVAQNTVYTLPVRQILSQQYTGVTTSYVDVRGTDAVCHEQAVSTAQTLSVYFVMTDSTGTVTEAVASAAINADLAAAIAPSNFTVAIGDDKLYPTWTTLTDPDITGFNVYYATEGAVLASQLVCPDAGDDGGGSGDSTSDASDVDGDSDGSTDGGGSDAGAATTPTSACVPMAVINPMPQADGNAQPFVKAGFACASPFPADDEQPADGGGRTTSTTTSADTDGSAEAGTTTITSTTGSIGPLSFQSQELDPTKYQFITAAAGANTATIPGLTDNVGYAVAVAAVDAYGNVGALTSASGLAWCQYPLATTDFWSSYKNEGGENEGCAIADPGALPGGAGLASLIAGAACVLLRRRRKPTRPS